MSVTEVGADRETLVDTATRGGAAAWRPAAGGGKWADRYGRKKPENPLAGGRYRTADNRWLLLALLQGDKAWPVFTKAIGRDDLAADARFGNEQGRAANAEVLVAELDRTFGGRPLVYWKMVLGGARLPYAIVQVAEEMAKYRDFIVASYSGAAALPVASRGFSCDEACAVHV
jgi:crotonobetainyl-CoA:carnitine CoA-transferase CaiB-like acyl-CoA transferase